MSAHENLEHAEHMEHAGHTNKKIALLIAILALFLAFSETFGKSAQTAAISDNVEAANLWAFFQAKTIRMTTLRTTAEHLQIDADRTTEPAVKDAMLKKIDEWKKTAARYDDEPSTGEGRKQLTERAKAAEEKRDLSLAKYHNFEIASAAFQIAIVLASATIITGMASLILTPFLFALAGVAFTGFGIFAPEMFEHILHAVGLG